MSTNNELTAFRQPKPGTFNLRVRSTDNEQAIASLKRSISEDLSSDNESRKKKLICLAHRPDFEARQKWNKDFATLSGLESEAGLATNQAGPWPLVTKESAKKQSESLLCDVISDMSKNVGRVSLSFYDQQRQQSSVPIDITSSNYGAPAQLGALGKLRTSYQRPPLRRVFCNKCTEYPEGFRGEHELRRHNDAKHAVLVKKWVCTDPEDHSAGTLRPVVPLRKCKACVSRKRYDGYYNAAAHLRRAHFNPHSGGNAQDEWPPRSI